MIRKRFSLANILALGILCAVVLIGSGARADTPPDGPMASVKGVVDQGIAVFKDQSLTPAERDKKLRAIAVGHFDFERMARSAVGLHWRDFSDQQRAEFVPLFTN